MKTKPNMYKKSILDINYDLLNKKGIKVLLFDLDNTLTVHKSFDLNKDFLPLFKKLKKDFTIYIVSNSLHTKKLDIVSKQLDVSYIGSAKKPFKYGFKKLNLSNPKEVAMIGDQVLTDVLGANKMGYFSILIDPINNDELFFTKINRFFEEIALKNNNLKRGDYYE